MGGPGIVDRTVRNVGEMQVDAAVVHGFVLLQSGHVQPDTAGVAWRQGFDARPPPAGASIAPTPALAAITQE